MPTRFNTDSQPHVVSYDQRAVMPGESHDFTDEEIAAGLAGSWSDVDPRAGLDDEKAFKKARDATRDELDKEATALGIDPAALSSKQEVVKAIKQALDTRAQSIEDTQSDPAESGENKE